MEKGLNYKLTLKAPAVMGRPRILGAPRVFGGGRRRRRFTAKEKRWIAEVGEVRLGKEVV